MSDARRWRGLAALVVDAVTNGSVAVERIQKETAARPFGILEKIPKVAAVTRVVHVVYDGSVTVTHTAVRFVTRAVGGAVDLAFDVADQYPGDPPPAGPPPKGPPPPPGGP